MRSAVPFFALALLGAPALLTAGCEDGPTQTFTPPPAGAAGNWNNGNTPGFADPGVDAGFVTPNTGQTRIEICPGPMKHAVWAEMLQKPILPPTTVAGINMAGLDANMNQDWHGITVDEAEKINCQSDVYGDAFGNGSIVNTWGDNGEVWFNYRVSNRKVIEMLVWPGYLGSLDFSCNDDPADPKKNPDKCPYGVHTYQMLLGQQIKKDGRPFTLDWVGNNGNNFPAQADELYRALMYQFASSLVTDPANVTCRDTGKCIKGHFGDVAYLYIPTLGWAYWVDNQNAAQPTPSIPTRMDIIPAKILGFSAADPTLKLEAEGPVAKVGPLDQATMPCVLKMGIKYSDFLANCIEVSGDKTKDQNELNKLLGGLSHGTERFHFDITGVDINFTDLALPADDIIHDTDLPHPNDVSTSFVVDQSTLGKLLNDWDTTQKPPVLDLHGTGAIYREYARLVRTNLLARAGVADGDPRQCLFPVGWQSNPNFNPDAFIASLPAWCTGFEGFVTPAPPTGKNDTVNIGATKLLALNPAMKLGMKLGHQKVTFCADANGTDYKACDGPYGLQGDTFSASFAHVQKVFGKGKVSNLPTEVQDVRFFFRMWVTALIKYLMNAASDQNPVRDLAAYQLNADDLFFDSIGAGQFELCEYVDRRYATIHQDPTDFVFEADVKNGIQDAYVFSRDLLRGEQALYQSMLENQADGLGQEENALLTNIFGSPVLKAGWKASKTKSAYYCATNLDPDNCDKQLAPNDGRGHLLLNEDGRPLLAPYPGAFGQTAFALGPTKVKVQTTYPNIQQAKIIIPLHADPYDPKSKGLASASYLVPWTPKQPGIGFPLALSGTLDKFIQTAQLDLSGTTITANIDYDSVIDPQTHMPDQNGNIQFLAVETTDFLGDVFLCQDAETGDLLRARMYTPVVTLLDWLQKHPKAYNNCGIIVRYSPFGNYADYITSLNGGVRLGITQGGGFGRVVDVTLFVPGQ